MSTPSAAISSATSLSPEEQLQSREALAQMLWTGGIVGFFVVQAVIWAIAITLTHRDPSHAVIADLDERVGSWDRRRAAQVASSELGWQVSVDVTPPTSGTSSHSVRLRLQNRDGEAVDADQIEVFGFHRARVTERKPLALEPLGPGVWGVAEDLKRKGWWRFEGRASAGNQEFTFRITEYLAL